MASSPELTSVDAMLKELCQKTCQNLMAILNPAEDAQGETVETKIPKKTVIATRLVTRETTRF